MLIPAAVFASIMAIIFGAYWLFVARPEIQDDETLQERLKIRRVTSLGARIVNEPRKLSAVGPLQAILFRSRRIGEPLQQLIEQAGLRVTPGAVILASVFIGAVTAALVGHFARSVWIALAGGVVAAPVPVLYVRHAARKRIALFEQQFPEAIDLMARAMRAGHALTTALEMVSEEVPAPVGTEFRILFEQQDYGMALAEALKAFARRVPVLDARFFVTALLIQREAGGNLSEVLDNLASVIRERFKVKRQVRVVSAHGRITGWVLGCLPLAVAIALLIISPAHIRILVEDPLGVQITVIAIGLQIVGVLIMRRIVDVEY